MSRAWSTRRPRRSACRSRRQYRANVILNFERSLMIARPLLEVELDDELTPAPVFRP